MRGIYCLRSILMISYSEEERLSLNLDRVSTENKTSQISAFEADKRVEGYPEIGSMSVSTNSEPVLRLATTWLSNCISSHIECSGDKSLNFRPTRLIAIVEQSGTLIAMLKDTNDLSKSEPYVALSYCWGSNSNAKLQHSNYREFQIKGLEVDQLPRTMQHAIYMTLHLGIKHIWIDALCIIQDRYDDWNHVALRMGDVYANSVVTIAAWGPSSCDEGLFSVRDPLSILRCKLYDTPQKGSIFAGPGGCSGTHYSYYLARGPLYQRGWVMQERLFAPRTLNFGSFISWECKRGSYWEVTRAQHVRHPVKTLFNDCAPNLPAEYSRRIIESWNGEVIPLYTASTLTRNSDRLMAISGAIQRLSDRTGWKNINGLWVPYLVEQLQWCRGTAGFAPDPSSISSRTGVSPSWSWASVDSGVSYLDRRRVKFYLHKASVLEVGQCILHSTDAHSAPGLLDLKLRGHLFELQAADQYTDTEPSPILLARIGQPQ